MILCVDPATRLRVTLLGMTKAEKETALDRLTGVIKVAKFLVVTESEENHVMD